MQLTVNPITTAGDAGVTDGGTPREGSLEKVKILVSWFNWHKSSFSKWCFIITI